MNIDQTPTLTNSRPEFRKFKKKLNPYLANLAAPHLQSFNDMLSEGLKDCISRLHSLQFQTPAGEKILIKVSQIVISKPQVPLDYINCKTTAVYPMECRQSSKSYSGKIQMSLDWSANNLDKLALEVDLGEVPIMVCSNACNLNGLNPENMVNKGEHESEWGGYFIIKGNEKIIRMLLMTRRNYPIALKRSTWKDRGQLFTEFGVLVRTVRSDEQAYNNVLHFLSNGTAKFMFSQMKFLSYIPVCLLLKCLVNDSDAMIYSQLTKGYEHDQYYQSSVQKMLSEVHEGGLHSQSECKNYLGELFRIKFPELPPWCSNSEVTDYILKERILLHLDDNIDKFNFIVLMVQKLFQCAQDQNKLETVDSVMMQEVLLSGHLYQKFLMDKIELWLIYLKKYILRKCNQTDILISPTIMQQCAKSAGTVTRSMESFLATGNAPSRSGMNLMQNTGLVIMAENINRMRYMSHFRAVHRGSFFVTMRTTEARILLPDAWGFICPVHTPDGTPCGLLNHLTVNCKISDRPKQNLVENISEILKEFGMIPFNTNSLLLTDHYIVMLEGKLLGYVRRSDASKIVDQLRYCKTEQKLPQMMEIVLVPFKKKGQFPGLFIFVGPSRMQRPVKNLNIDHIEFIGSFEQVYMDIAIDHKERYPGLTTHMELSKTDFLSNLALLIPLPDYNQSPRNMYQCQMGKQTMGTPCHNWQIQANNKLYRLQTPHTPLFRPVHHDNIELDDFPMGINAIVAVISYTGYDMEDAMIINKSAYERGFADGSIFKSHNIELRGQSYFARDPHNHNLTRYLDNDGLPYPGRQINYKSVLYCYFDADEAIYKVVKNDEKENAVIDNIKYIGNFKANHPKMICITLRIPRAPTIGDKFASRAGQKGVCSQRYPAEDLPFTETGLIPDIVFNPHGFPSRMTIAMMIETMAGKGAAIHGCVHDATPFRFSEKHTAIDYFGKLLEKAGYNYYGTERLYSGVDGREMNADIFFGVVHYQRLRHMVFDKYQVRSTGAVDSITHQPIKGRKRGGGVRFGEMERDALISYGAAYLLQDRLYHCSDRTLTLVCNKCGSILSPMRNILKRSMDGSVSSTSATCRICNDSSQIGYIDIPYCYKYLVTELSSVNINAKFKFTSI